MKTIDMGIVIICMFFSTMGCYHIGDKETKSNSNNSDTFSTEYSHYAKSSITSTGSNNTDTFSTEYSHYSKSSITNYTEQSETTNATDSTDETSYTESDNVCTKYSIVNLEDKTTYKSVAFDINVHGDIVGITKNPSITLALKQKPFQLSDNTVFDFGSKYEPLNLTNLLALGINDNGLIIGYGADDNFESTIHAVCWTFDGPMVYLNSARQETRPTDVNNQGQIVGYSETFSIEALAYITQAFVWDASGDIVVELKLPVTSDTTGATGSFATSINNNGEIAGYLSLVDGTEIPVVWSKNHEGEYVVEKLPTLFGGNGRATNIADDGTIYGQFTIEPGMTHAVIWKDSASVPLPLTTGIESESRIVAKVSDVNANGVAIGWDELDNSFETRGWIYKNGIKTDLNDHLVRTDANWQITETYSINEHGHILGMALNENQSYAVHLIPQECE